MTPMVGLLRGINVGGRARLAMADLRGVVEGCGYQSVHTYIQSGNLVFLAPSDKPDDVASQLTEAIADSTDVRPSVMVRTASEWDAIVAGNPFVDRGADPKQLHVIVFGDSLLGIEDSYDWDSLLPEEVDFGHRHLYLFLPDGLGRSAMAQTVDRKTGKSGTARNWRTVAKLADMVAGLG